MICHRFGFFGFLDGIGWVYGDCQGLITLSPLTVNILLSLFYRTKFTLDASLVRSSDWNCGLISRCCIHIGLFHYRKSHLNHSCTAIADSDMRSIIIIVVKSRTRKILICSLKHFNVLRVTSKNAFMSRPCGFHSVNGLIRQNVNQALKTTSHQFYPTAC